MVVRLVHSAEPKPPSKLKVALAMAFVFMWIMLFVILGLLIIGTGFAIVLAPLLLLFKLLGVLF